MRACKGSVDWVGVEAHRLDALVLIMLRQHRCDQRFPNAALALQNKIDGSHGFGFFHVWESVQNVPPNGRGWFLT